MNARLKVLCAELSNIIKAAYEESVSILEAEKLAARFLHAQLDIADALQIADLNARMHKNGTKAVKAAVYMEEATRGDKKPSDTFLQNVVDRDKLVIEQQTAWDEAEVEHDSLNNYFGIFKDAHIYFRGIAKGNFNG